MAGQGLRIRRLGAAAVVIAAGLALRRYGYELGLSFLLVKYGGSCLWGAIVYVMAGALTGSARTGRLAIIAIVIAALVEFSRLYHTLGLDAFRLTLPGQLLLGRVFSCWNILAYTLGIGAALLGEGLLEVLLTPVRRSAP